MFEALVISSLPLPRPTNAKPSSSTTQARHKTRISRRFRFGGSSEPVVRPSVGKAVEPSLLGEQCHERASSAPVSKPVSVHARIYDGHGPCAGSWRKILPEERQTGGNEGDHHRCR